jgi:hypothetical protein
MERFPHKKKRKKLGHYDSKRLLNSNGGPRSGRRDLGEPT